MEMGDAAGTTVDGGVRHASRLLRFPLRHLSGPHQLTPSPRGSFNSLVAHALPALTPGPDEVRLVVITSASPAKCEHW